MFVALVPLKNGDALYPFLLKFAVTGFLTRTQRKLAKLGLGAVAMLLLALFYRKYFG